jgi:hypothetical protein
VTPGSVTPTPTAAFSSISYSTCPAGTYGASGSACVPCPAGSYSFAGAISCFMCPLGFLSTAGSPLCAPVIRFAGKPFTLSVSALSQCTVANKTAGYRTSLAQAWSTFPYCSADLNLQTANPMGVDSFCMLSRSRMHTNYPIQCGLPAAGVCMPSFMYTLPGAVYEGTRLSFVAESGCPSCSDGVTYRLRKIISGAATELATALSCSSTGIVFVVPDSLDAGTQL